MWQTAKLTSWTSNQVRNKRDYRISDILLISFIAIRIGMFVMLSVLICRLVCRDFAVRIISPTAFHYVLMFLAKCCVEIMDLEAGQEQTRLSDFLLISFIAIQIGMCVKVISSHLATGLS